MCCENQDRGHKTAPRGAAVKAGLIGEMTTKPGEGVEGETAQRREHVCYVWGPAPAAGTHRKGGRSDERFLWESGRDQTRRGMIRNLPWRGFEHLGLDLCFGDTSVVKVRPQEGGGHWRGRSRWPETQTWQWGAGSHDQDPKIMRRLHTPALVWIGYGQRGAEKGDVQVSNLGYLVPSTEIIQLRGRDGRKREDLAAKEISNLECS